MTIFLNIVIFFLNTNVFLIYLLIIIQNKLRNCYATQKLNAIVCTIISKSLRPDQIFGT